jgi:hypothetical protein
LLFAVPSISICIVLKEQLKIDSEKNFRKIFQSIWELPSHRILSEIVVENHFWGTMRMKGGYCTGNTVRHCSSCSKLRDAPGFFHIVEDGHLSRAKYSLNKRKNWETVKNLRDEGKSAEMIVGEKVENWNKICKNRRQKCISHIEPVEGNEEHSQDRSITHVVVHPLSQIADIPFLKAPTYLSKHNFKNGRKLKALRKGKGRNKEGLGTILPKNQQKYDLYLK